MILTYAEIREIDYWELPKLISQCLLRTENITKNLRKTRSEKKQKELEKALNQERQLLKKLEKVLAEEQEKTRLALMAEGGTYGEI